MARVNRAFGRRLSSWMSSRKLSGMQAAFQANLSVSVATVNNWKRGMVPRDPDQFIAFIRANGETDLEPWLKLLGLRRAA